MQEQVAAEPGVAVAVRLLAGRRTAVLTGAGLSTDSGIPDYRGQGSQPRNPMSITQFLTDEQYRKRYWAGSQLGWERFSAAQPNTGHRALATMEHAGVVNGVITQNVDGLHLRAGSRRIVDLHGTMDRVRCVNCGQIFSRDGIAERVAADNLWLAEVDTTELGPDGDVAIDDVDRMRIPECDVCGGILKPDIVYFGEFIPAGKFAEASALVQDADALIVAGSSLAVNSGIRIVEQAHRRNLPVVIINRGDTKGDPRATLKIDAGTSEVLRYFADHLVPAARA